jgi:membrane dipeptidase
MSRSPERWRRPREQDRAITGTGHVCFPTVTTADADALSNALARAMLTRFPLIDGHNDLPWAIRQQYAATGSSGLEKALDAAAIDKRAPAFHTDIPRLVEGGVGGQFWSVYVPGALAADEAVRVTLDQVDLVRRLIRKYPSRFSLALTAQDVEQAFRAGRIASLLGAEGGHSIGGSLGVLRSLHALGVRYMTLTHNQNVGWADSATDVPDAGGLTDFGRDVVAEMQRLGMLVDLSHVAQTTMNDALDVARAPVIFSHSSARAVCDSPRNVPDDVLGRLAANGGVCMVAFVPAFVSQECADWLAGLKKEAGRRGIDPRDLAGVFALSAQYRAGHPLPQATLSQVADHIEHVRDVAGIEHVGIGGDFDGTPDLPVGLGDVSRYPALLGELARRGWSEADCEALAGGNILRALRDAETFSASRR